ncbi:MAG: lysophospholipid acyltransferase family protein [Pirellulaceae bacterium]|jgi:hypothetical protein
MKRARRWTSGLKRLRNKTFNRTLWRFSGMTLAKAVVSWMDTLQFQSLYVDPTTDPGLPIFQGPCIFLFWHEYLAFPFALRGHCGIAMLVSRHEDAEWLSQAAHFRGFQTIRGSSSRGGTEVLRQLLNEGSGLNLAVTPDGPRGPRRNLAVGAVYLAMKMQVPIVLVGFGYDRPWRVRRAWDQFAIPRPGSRARAVFSDRIHLPEKLSRDELEGWRARLEAQLLELTEKAEHWATSGASIPGAWPLYRAPWKGAQGSLPKRPSE